MDVKAYIDKQWVKGLMEGNETTFRAIYDAYRHPVFSFAVYLTKSPDIAEEVVQEAFIRLWEKRASLEEDSHLLGFLKKVTQNLVLDLFRRARRDRSLQKHIHEHMIALEQQGADKLWERELHKVYRQALERLPPQQQVVFMLSRDENLSYQEIANQLGLSPHTVRNHMVAAIRSVRHYVQHNADLACVILAILLHERR